MSGILIILLLLGVAGIGMFAILLFIFLPLLLDLVSEYFKGKM